MRRLKSPYVLVPVAALLLLVGWFAWQMFGPSPAIIVSRETTHITSPLRPNGLPDYEAYLLEQMRAGVTPDNNAAVLLWQAVGPLDQKPDEFDAVCREIGIEKLPPASEFLREVADPKWQQQLQKWLTDAGMIEERGSEEDFDPEEIASEESLADVADELTAQLSERPWTREQIPPMGKWLDENEKALNLLVAGSKRPRFYSPSHEFLNGKADSLSSMFLSSMQAQRAVVRSLAVRAMWQLGAGHHEQAWEDILAIYRWSLLLGRGETLVQQLVSFALESCAEQPTLALLGSDELSETLARKIQQDLSSLSRNRVTIAETFNKGERIFGLSMIIDELLLGEVAGIPGAKFLAFDWNIPLRRMNRMYDAIFDAAKLPDWSSRQQAMLQFESNLERDLAKSKVRKYTSMLSRQGRSELMADIIVSLLMPSVTATMAAEDRTNTQQTLIRLAAALAVYRAEGGEYPDQLQALVPDVLEKLPVDLYRGKPFAYRRTENGYLLYSCGPNGKDDGGSNERMNVFQGYSTEVEVATLLQLLGGDAPVALSQAEQDRLDPNSLEQIEARGEVASHIPADTDDIAIRMPRPKLVLPTPQNKALNRE